MPVRAAVLSAVGPLRSCTGRTGRATLGRASTGGGGRTDCLDRAGRGAYRHSAVARPPSRHTARQRSDDHAGPLDRRVRSDRRDYRRGALAGAAAQPGACLGLQGDRPHRADPRHLRRARGHEGRCAPGGTGASRLSALAPGAVVDPPRAAARRLRLPGRPRRDADRGGSPPDRRAHGAAEEGSGAGAAHPRTAPLRAAARAVPGGGTGRLHQCWKINTVQCADRGGGGGARPVVRHAGSDHARAAPAVRRGA